MVEAGDLDRDGKSDLLVSAPFSGTTSYGFDGPGSAYAISGADGHVIYRVDGDASGDDLGWCLASIGDLNGDGIPELLIGAPDNPTTGIGYVKIVDGATGALIARINDPDGPNPYPNSVFGTNEFGDAVSEAGDVNGDGVPDFMVGAPSARPNGMNNAGSVFIYSGKIDPVTHQFPLLYRFNGEHPNDLFGGCCGGVDSIGDLDGDGIGDLVVAAPAANPNGKLDAGSVYVFSGRTGTLLYRLDGENPEDFFGGNNCGCGPVTKLPDLDGDRVPELLIGAPLVSVPSSGPGKVTDVGRVYVYSGRTGTLLQKIENPDPVNFRLFGNSVDNLGDINGDGKLEIIIGAPTMTFDFPLVMIETNHVVGKIGPGKYYVFSLSTFKNADTIPPTTIATPSPAPNANGWNNTNVNVTLTSTDNTGGSGVKEIHYTINANPEIVVSGASTMINLTSEGITTIGYHAVDNAGNVELGHTLSVKIDKTPPVIASSQVPAANVAGWNNSNVTISFSVTDNLSGGVTCTANTATLSTEGVNQTASTTCTDTAGNSATASRTVSIDKTPPTILFGSATPPPNAAGWNNTNVSVPFTAADFLAGVAGTSVSSPLVLSAEGSAVTGTVTATDVAGNSATFTSPAFKIDKTPPVISSSQLPAANGAGWNNTNVAISFSATDTLSGGVICTV
ncbi:MAG: FG-GAP repeat protein, partial [Deltaproteobacteria bacterium]|nr:FG-GAP repeat protein [Deltaproteobacteria bacterium]